MEEIQRFDHLAIREMVGGIDSRHLGVGAGISASCRAFAPGEAHCAGSRLAGPRGQLASAGARALAIWGKRRSIPRGTALSQAELGGGAVVRKRAGQEVSAAHGNSSSAASTQSISSGVL